MKRKSILMTIVMLLFAGIAVGQRGPKWPETGDIGGTGFPKANRVDTVYFCQDINAQYPIELGYDGLGLSLHPSYGEWSLYATSNNNVAADYDFNTGNGGAGNAFQTVGTKYGGYIFQYVSKDPGCGMAINDKFWVFVFVLPTEDNAVEQRDTIACLKDVKTSGVTKNFSIVYADYIDLYKKAGFNPLPTFKENIHKLPASSLPEKGTKDTVFVDTIVIAATGFPKNGNEAFKYSCGDTIRFSYKVKVTDFIGQLPSKGLSVCLSDTSTYKGMLPKDLFDRKNIPGTYDVNEVYTNFGGLEDITGTITGIASTIKVYKRVFTFTYDDKCATPEETNLKVKDSIIFIEKFHANPNWGRDTAVFCRGEIVGTQASIFEFYNNAQIDYPLIGIPKLPLDNTNSYWYDRGIRDKDNKPGGNGTVHNVPSLPENTYDVLVEELKANVGYNYLWRLSLTKFPCFVDADNNPDSGYIVVIIQDPLLAQDYTSQLCKKSYGNTGKFSLAQYTGLRGIQWSSINIPNSALSASKDTVYIGSLTPNTYKLKYNLPASTCSIGGDGVFYLKVSDRVVVPQSKTVTFCVEKLPAQINLNDVLNISVNGLVWQYVPVTSNGSPASLGSEFNTTTGILDVNQYTTAHGSGVVELKFKTVVPGGVNSCITDGQELTIKFGDL
jgi:hypothetical protein